MGFHLISSFILFFHYTPATLVKKKKEKKNISWKNIFFQKILSGSTVLYVGKFCAPQEKHAVLALGDGVN